MSMPSTSPNCEICSQPMLITDEQCSHCFKLFCYQCLAQHHHTTVLHEFKDMIKQIDRCLAPFLHHAHNQTEWTDHLTDDRNRLDNYVYYIETSYPRLPVYSLPNCAWITHVKELIDKRSFAIYEDCYKILYPTATSCIKL